jgi:chemotaxis protein MotB
MARKKKHPAHENHERWLVSYADFITLLFAFFVVMFASSQVDKGKAKQVSASVTEALETGGATGTAAKVAMILGGTVDDIGPGNALMKGPGGAQRATKDSPPEEVIELIPSLKKLSEQLREEVAAGKLELSLEPRGLVISLKQAVFFPSGEDFIDPATYPIVEKIAALLASHPNRIRLEGHTDSVPIRTARFPSNWELSTARAIAMLRLLTERFHVNHLQLVVAGYADTSPVGPNDTDEGRSRNRRVDIVILSELGVRMIEGKEPVPQPDDKESPDHKEPAPQPAH